MPNLMSKSIHPDDISYVRNATAAIRNEKIRGASLLLFSVIFSLAALVYWSSVSEIDEVTKGTGKVIPSSSVQTVQNLEGGIVADILISEGDFVKAGDVLVRIDDTQRNSIFMENLSKAQAYEALLARLLAEGRATPEIEFPKDIAEARPELVARERALFAKRARERDTQRQLFEESLALAQEELALTIPAVKRNVVPKVDMLRLEREVNDIEGQLYSLTGGFEQESMEEYNTVKAELEALRQAMSARQDSVDRTLVRSPVDGTVNKVYVSTVGGVIQGGEPIVDIVPKDDALLVEAKIRPSDIAFLHAGQKATVKFTAYDFAIYGGLEGEVVHISADTIMDEIDQQHYYMIKVRNEDGRLIKAGEELPIITGMVTEVDVLTGRRTVLEYLTKPFHRMRLNSLKER